MERYHKYVYYSIQTVHKYHTNTNLSAFLQCADEPVYDTDHTDLNSDFDEAELRRELLKDVSIYLN